MMYLALTYDHRLLDGREAVVFLVKVNRSAASLLKSDTDCLEGQGIHRRSEENVTRLKE